MTSGPRDGHRLTGRDEWVVAVAADKVKPDGLPEALAVAFTAACLDGVGDPEMLALEAGEDTGGHTRAAYVRLARSLGMGRERFRLTLQGARWLTLPEAKAAFADPLVGTRFNRHLARFGCDVGVLHKDRNSGGTSPQPAGGRKIASSATRPGKDTTVAESVAIREERVRADIETLARQQQRARQQGDTVGSVDWSAVRRLIGDAPLPASTAPYPGRASRIRAAGIESLADLLRSILRDAPGAMLSYRIKEEVERQVKGQQPGISRRLPPISSDQVDTALARLAARGEIERLRHGVYQATDEMKGDAADS